MSLLPSSPNSPTPATDFYVLRLQANETILHRELLKAWKAMKKSANRRRRKTHDFATGEKVWLLRRYISTSRPSSKLDVRRLGPFIIIGRVGTLEFRLDLPPSMQVHDVFHVSLLEPHVPKPFPSRVVAPLLAIHVDNIPEFEVQSVLDSKFR